MEKNYIDKGLSGIINLGNTCYLNSAVQCLSNTLELTDYFLTQKYEEDLNKSKKESKMSYEYYRIIEGMWESNCIIKPVSFLQTFVLHEPKFRGFGQQDSQEALSLLLNILHTGLSYEVNLTFSGEAKNDLDKLMIESIKSWRTTFKKEYSKILELFFGQYHSQLTCPKCGKFSHNFDPFCLITLPITKNSNNIYDCFNEFTKDEILDTDNQWKCENCHQMTNAIKNIKIWKPPEILIIVLKRFKFGMHSLKITKKIEFPLNNLNLENYVQGYETYNSTYNAYAIINHVGGMGGGHYYSYCKNASGKWWEFNDEDVKELSDIKQDNAYVIFYKKQK